jgi:transposase
MTKWLGDHHIPIFFHPPNSPNLNPIEPVWLELKCILHGQWHTSTTIEQLKTAVLTAWEEISVETINKHISKMPDHVSAVLAAKGGHTQF